MRKILFAICVVGLFSIQSQAQIRIGAKAGISTVGISSSSLDDYLKDNTIGFYVGPSLEWLIKGKFGFDASVLYSQRGISFENQDTERTGYIEIPINAKYVIHLNKNIGVFAGAGPYINFRVAGDKDFQVAANQIQGQWEAKSFGAGLNFNGGFQLFRILQLGTNYSLGFTDDYASSNGDYSVKGRVWSLYAAIYF